MSLKSWIYSNFLESKSNNVEAVVSSNKLEGGTLTYKLLAVQTAASLIANAISKAEVKCYVNGKSVKDDDYFALNYRPNPNQNSSQFWNEVINRMIWNECEKGALVLPWNDRLYCAESYSYTENGLAANLYNNISINGKNIPGTFTADEVYLFKLENEAVIKYIDALFNDYGLILQYAINAYKKANGTKMKLKIDSVRAGSKDFNEKYKNEITKELKKFISAENGVYPQFDGYDLSVLDMGDAGSSSDIQSIRKDIFEMVGNAFHIPSSLMLGNVNSMKDVINLFITEAVDPIASMISEELTAKEGLNEFNSGTRFEVDTTLINHVDLFDIAGEADKLISAGICSINEVREKIKLSEINEEWADIHYITKNYSDMNGMNEFEESEEINNEKILSASE